MDESGRSISVREKVWEVEVTPYMVPEGAKAMKRWKTVDDLQKNNPRLVSYFFLVKCGETNILQIALDLTAVAIMKIDITKNGRHWRTYFAYKYAISFRVLKFCMSNLKRDDGSQFPAGFFALMIHVFFKRIGKPFLKLCTNEYSFTEGFQEYFMNKSLEQLKK